MSDFWFVTILVVGSFVAGYLVGRSEASYWKSAWKQLDASKDDIVQKFLELRDELTAEQMTANSLREKLRHVTQERVEDDMHQR